jgi:hypothetical protein
MKPLTSRGCRTDFAPVAAPSRLAYLGGNIRTKGDFFLKSISRLRLRDHTVMLGEKGDGVARLLISCIYAMGLDFAVTNFAGAYILPSTNF